MTAKHRIIGTSLILIILMKTGTMLYTLTAFSLNQQYYAEVLCINKNKPELKCQGKCVLMQRLQAQLDLRHQKQTDALIHLMGRMIETVDCISPVFSTVSCLMGTGTSTLTFIFSNLVGRINPKGIFHPPA